MVNRYGLFSMVRRSDLAAWMVDVAEGKRAVEGPAALVGTVW